MSPARNFFCGKFRSFLIKPTDPWFNLSFLNTKKKVLDIARLKKFHKR